MRKICIIVNSRANYSRIYSVLKAIQKHKKLKLQLVVGASALLYRFGKVINKIEKDGFRPVAKLYSIVEGENPVTMAKSTGIAIIELSTIFENLKPDIVLTVADRFETLATAVAASYMNIPLAHTQGGEQTGSIDESVRHAITKLAHIHFPATNKSKINLLKMGENKKFIFNYGCPSIDLIDNKKLKISSNLFTNIGGVGNKIDLFKPYLVILQHPVTTEYKSTINQINETILAIKKINMQTIWLWPNVDAGSDEISKRLRMFREKYSKFPIRFIRNFDPEDYLKIIYNSSCLVGNSSSAIREGSYLGIPAVNIGTRQRDRERGINILDVPYEKLKIFNAIKKQLKINKYRRSNLYGKGNSGIKIANKLATIKLTINKKLNY